VSLRIVDEQLFFRYFDLEFKFIVCIKIVQVVVRRKKNFQSISMNLTHVLHFGLCFLYFSLKIFINLFLSIDILKIIDKLLNQRSFCLTVRLSLHLLDNLLCVLYYLQVYLTFIDSF